MSKHTPGDWVVKDSAIVSPSQYGEKTVAWASTCLLEHEANARLIAAAPEMLEALHFIGQTLTNAMNTQDVDARTKLMNMAASRAVRIVYKAEEK